MRTIWLICISILFTTCIVNSQKEEFLKQLREEHPRLLITEEAFERMDTLLQRDSLYKKLYELTIKIADSIVSYPVITYSPDIRNTILHQSRSAISVITTTAMAYLLTKEKKYKERAVKEMLNVASFPSWNPSHFLDVAEMSTAMALGYDWLYNDLSSIERDSIREAILRKGIHEYMKSFREGKIWWINTDNNWNLVCNGGMMLSSLAIAEDYPDIAREVIDTAISRIPSCMKHYVPSGAWYEGQAYWGYATYYAVLAISSLETALGNDKGLSAMKGFEHAAEWFFELTSPSWKIFNFADAGSDAFPFNPSFFWFSKRFSQAHIASYYRKFLEENLDKDIIDINKLFKNRFFSFHLLFYDDEKITNSGEDTKGKLLDGDVQIVRFRSNSTNDALFFAMKGGDNEENHQQLDIGTFVLESQGARWAVDMGSEEYHLPNFFHKHPGGDRWKYYRNTNKSHSTLVIGDTLQEVKAKARFKTFVDARNPVAVLDMTEAYRNLALKTTRTAAMVDDQVIILEDNIDNVHKGETIRWAMITKAKVSIENNLVVLEQDGKKFYLLLSSPSTAVFEEYSTRPSLDIESQNEVYRMIGFTVKSRKYEELHRLRVVMGNHRETVEKYRNFMLKP